MLRATFNFRQLLHSKRSGKKKTDGIIFILSLLILLGIINVFASCADDTSKLVCKGDVSFRIAGEGMQTRVYQGNDSGDDLDRAIYMIRILAFDNATPRRIKYNERFFGAALNEVISLKMLEGTYDFVFLANEPGSFTTELDNLSSYSDLQTIAYPESVFTSTAVIPMIAASDGVVVSSNANSLTVDLRRLAVRLDVVLKAEMDLGDGTNPVTDDFKGITLSGIPDRVPLVWGLPSAPLADRWDYADPDLAYSNNEKPVNRNIIRSFTVIDNPEYFGETLYPTNPDDGLTWSKKINRIILPANYLSDDAGENIAANATLFTVNLSTDKYSPSSELKISSKTDTENPSSEDDYKLPANAFLKFQGNIKQPIEINIKAENWTEVLNSWKITGERILNVSQTSASITGLNGVRISFWSNMPVVKVLNEVIRDGSTEVETNIAFNDLANPTQDAQGNYSTTRFSYNPKTGSGYMDIIVDGGASIDNFIPTGGIYNLILSAEDENGGNALQRTIPIEVNTLGYVFYTSAYNNNYNGVFFRHNEVGERIITGQANTKITNEWTVTVPEEFQDWIVLSTTPSFDPGAGTDNPGSAEDHLVIPNAYKGEDGTKVTGKGRVYYRIGLKKSMVASKDDDPVYAYLNCTYVEWPQNRKVYIRQGEAADYLLRKSDPIIKNSNILDYYQPLRDDIERTAAAKFAPYNLTAATYNQNPVDENYYTTIEAHQGAFVEYPSQGGAYFQWGLDLSNDASIPFRGAAYNPRKNQKDNFPNNWMSFKNGSHNVSAVPIMWKPDAGSEQINYSDRYEICPSGYHRPSDGPVNQIAYNGYYDRLPADTLPVPIDYGDNIRESEMRVSLFRTPYAGNAAAHADYPTISSSSPKGTFPDGSNVRRQLPGTLMTLYADGFFDRRPIVKYEIQNKIFGFCVSPNTTTVAYPGVLFFNDLSDSNNIISNASLFLPCAGRIGNDWADRGGQGTQGYYWTSSAGAKYAGSDRYGSRQIQNGAWNYEIAFYQIFPLNNYADFANTIRCVKD